MDHQIKTSYNLELDRPPALGVGMRKTGDQSASQDAVYVH